MPAEFDYSTLTYEDRVDIHKALTRATLKHVRRAGGLLVAVDYAPDPTEENPDGHPCQLVETIELLPTESTFEENRFYTDSANPRLGPLIREELPKNKKFLKEAREALEDGTHITKFAPHLQIDDLAYSEAAWAEISGMEDWQDRNACILARGITAIGAFDMVAAEVMQKAGHVFLTFPRTETTSGLSIPTGLINTNNLRLRTAVDNWFNKPSPSTEPEGSSKALQLAMEGKTADISYGDNHKPERVVLGKIEKASLRFAPGLCAPELIVDGDDPAYEVGELTEMKTRSDIERVQGWQRERLAYILGLSDDAVTIAA